MTLFSYDRYYLLSLYKNVLKVVEFNVYTIYVLDIEKERSILRDNIEFNSSDKRIHRSCSFSYRRSFSKTDIVVAVYRTIKLNRFVHSLKCLELWFPRR